jgi:hypothetical protein
LKTERASLVAAARELAAIDLMSSLRQISAPQLVPLPGAGHLWPVKRPTPLTDHIRQLASLNGQGTAVKPPGADSAARGAVR